LVLLVQIFSPKPPDQQQDTQLFILFIFSHQFEYSIGRHLGLHQVVI
jgi:hypothetical protein